VKRIEANSVTAWYGAFKAVADVTLAIEPKQVTALIGPSGCGKSTFIRKEVRDRLDRPGASLSGGQQQRLCIARAIAVEPQVLLMDEPCSALDPVSTLRIEDLIAELKDKYTIVIVTHNMQQAARVSDSTAFFTLEKAGEPGRLVEFGPTAHIFTRPDDERTEAYITGRFG